MRDPPLMLGRGIVVQQSGGASQQVVRMAAPHARGGELAERTLGVGTHARRAFRAQPGAQNGHPRGDRWTAVDEFAVVGVGGLLTRSEPTLRLIGPASVCV